MADRSKANGSAKAILLTVLGEYVLPGDGAVWTSTIVEGLALFEISERNARQAVARLSDQGIVTAERHGRRVRWRLTDSGHKLLSVGAERIYGFGTDSSAWDSRWLVVFVSVPEELRAKRHQLRSQLEFAGFGFLGPGIAISPHVSRERVANAILTDLGLDDGALVLRAETGELMSNSEVLRRAWDLARIADRYTDFIHEFVPRKPRAPAGRFVALTELVHAWRRFPFGDPEIPDSLVPRHWPGRRAKQLFDDRHAAWSASAIQWFHDAEATEAPVSSP